MSLSVWVLLAGCAKVPDCDSPQAEKLMADTVYTLVKNSLRESDEPGGVAQDAPHPDAVQVSLRHEAMTDRYLPLVAVADDIKWLRPRIAAQTPERHRGIGLPVYLMLHDFGAIRRAVKVRLTDHEHLPDRTEDGRVFAKVCRAKLTIEPTTPSSRNFDSMTLTYSVNPPPSGSRSHRAGPFYVAINFFEATEPPLSFALSDSEKVTLMMMGASNDMQARPKTQSPILQITRRALRAFRSHFESTQTRTDGARKAPTEPAPDGKQAPGAMSNVDPPGKHQRALVAGRSH